MKKSLGESFLFATAPPKKQRAHVAGLSTFAMERLHEFQPEQVLHDPWLAAKYP